MCHSVVCDYFRTPLMPWKMLASGEQSLNLENCTPVPQTQTWTLITGHCIHMMNAHEAVLTYHVFCWLGNKACVLCLCCSRVLWEVWIPVMRSCVSGWQPRTVGPMVDCVEVWAPLLPLWILDNLLEQLILPRLQREARHRHTLALH